MSRIAAAFLVGLKVPLDLSENLAVGNHVIPNVLEQLDARCPGANPHFDICQDLPLGVVLDGETPLLVADLEPVHEYGYERELTLPPHPRPLTALVRGDVLSRA